MLALLAMGAMFSGLDNPGYGLGSSSDNLSKYDLDELRKKQEENKSKYLANKGLKKYSSLGVTVYALNDKNGYRKLNKALAILGYV